MTDTLTNPTTVAYKYLTGIYTARHASYRPPKVDRRTRFGKAVLSEYNRLKAKINYAEVRLKQHERMKSRHAFVNILGTPIVKDWLSNKGRGIRVMTDRLTDGYRNHWAKNERDLRILAILKKYTPSGMKYCA